MSHNNTEIQCKIHPERTTDLFCLNCKILVCTKCFKSDHKKCEFEDYDDYYEQIVASSRDLIQNSENNVHQIQNYQPQVLSKYENAKQVNEKLRQSINTIFREIHDTLHIKEVDLKREIGSLDSENEQNYVQLVSYYQNQVEQLEDSVKDLKLSGTSATDKINFIKAYSKINQPSNTSPSIKNDHVTYLVGNVNLSALESIKDIVLSVGLLSNIPPVPPPNPHFSNNNNNNNNSKNNNNNNNNNSNNLTYPHLAKISHHASNHNNNKLYRCNNTSSNKYRLENFESILIKSTPINSNAVFPNNVVYQNNTFGDNKFVVFNTGKNVVYNIDDSWISPTSIIGLPKDISTIFDGKDTVYIFGISEDNPSVTQIWKYNIYTCTFLYVRNKLPIALPLSSLTIHNDIIYIIGSYTTIIGTFGTVIFKFNINTEIIDGTEILNIDDTKKNVGGCYIPNTNTFYLIEDIYLYKMQLDNKLKLRVKGIQFPVSDHVKMIYDNYDLIYCIPYSHTYNSILGLIEFNIKNLTLTPFRNMFLPNEYISILN